MPGIDRNGAQDSWSLLALEVIHFHFDRYLAKVWSALGPHPTALRVLNLLSDLVPFCVHRLEVLGRA